MQRLDNRPGVARGLGQAEALGSADRVRGLVRELGGEDRQLTQQAGPTGEVLVAGLMREVAYSLAAEVEQLGAELPVADPADRQCGLGQHPRIPGRPGAAGDHPHHRHRVTEQPRPVEDAGLLQRQPLRPRVVVGRSDRRSPVEGSPAARGQS